MSPRSQATTKLTLRAVVKPNARQPAIVSDGDKLRLSVRSPPIDGRANAEATAMIARLFGVPKGRVTLLRGARGRLKQFEIVDPKSVPAELARYCVGESVPPRAPVSG